MMIDCNVASDCPNGGTNYQCYANECLCASGFVQDASDHCVGMLHQDA